MTRASVVLGCLFLAGACTALPEADPSGDAGARRPGKEGPEGTEPFQVAAAGGHVDVLPKTPGYLEVQLDKLQATLVRRPKRAEVPVTAEVQLVVEYYAAR